MEPIGFDVNGGIDEINNNIFETLKNMEVSSKKALRIKNRSILLNKATELLHAIVTVACK